MNDDELKSLLRSADAGVEKPVFATGELAERVRRLDRRRRRRARLLVAAAPVLGVVTIAAWFLPQKAVPTNADRRAASVPSDVREIERLRAEAAYQEQMARAMISLAERERVARSVAVVGEESDPLDEIREQVDVVAYRMILRADDLYARKMDSPEVVELYREVMQLFPKTYSAEVARRRLTDLGASVEDT